MRLDALGFVVPTVAGASSDPSDMKSFHPDNLLGGVLGRDTNSSPKEFDTGIDSTDEGFDDKDMVEMLSGMSRLSGFFHWHSSPNHNRHGKESARYETSCGCVVVL